MKISISTPDEKQIKQSNFESWGTWECGISDFPWSYDSRETCFILEGHAVITTPWEKVEIQKNNLVIFPEGLTCTWNITKPIRKYYKFG
ncbi:MAG: cupin domain-containing protein [Oligoflexia bacterium]|nr:cupin domain-containing protein [Oligoflexia bacterium]